MLQISAFSNASAIQRLIWISAFALLVCFSVHASQSPSSNSEEYSNVKRSDFPSEFVFGISTAAAQIEGATKSGGKGPSIWDQFVREFPDKIHDKSNLDVATESYKLYNEDVQAVKDLGVDAYRFSLSWTRILPNGTLSGGINQEGIDHYNRFIDALVKNGIKPFVTLFHFDSPEALEHKYGGFLNHSIMEDFKNYAELCFKTFGDRVQGWITINEPLIIAKFGYTMGIAPPGRCSNRTMCPSGNSATEPYIVSHNLLLAHAAAAKLYKDKYQKAQKGQIGLSLVGQHYEPYSETSSDKDAAKRAMDFELGWFVEPLLRGEYPKIMRELVKDRLPSFTAQQKKLVKGSFDFIGINYYTARYAKDIPFKPNDTPKSFVEDQHVHATKERDGVFIGPNAGGSMFIYVYPPGLYKLLKFMQEHYDKNLTVYITENGVTGNKTDSSPLNDQFRIEFIQKHLHHLRRAIKDGVDVKGYFVWSLLDNWEWNEGFNISYGLYYVDRKNNFRRIPKKSVKWYHDFVKGDKKQAS